MKTLLLCAALVGMAGGQDLKVTASPEFMSVEPSFCLGSQCAIAAMLDDGSLEIEPLTSQEISNLGKLKAAADKAKAELETETRAVREHHGDRRMAMGTRFTMCPVTMSGEKAEKPSETIVEIRGKYAFRTKRPLFECSGSLLGW